MFCWVYKHRKTQEVVLVQRPHRKAAEPKYSVKHYRKLNRDLTYDIVEVLESAKFRAQYVFVGRLKEEVCQKLLQP